MSLSDRRYGNQVVTFVDIVEDDDADPNLLGAKPKVPTSVDVRYCRHRPLRVTETPEYLTNTGDQYWKTTAPPEAAAIAARATGKLIVDGVTYEIIGGAMPFTDFTGEVVKVTILSFAK